MARERFGVALIIAGLFASAALTVAVGMLTVVGYFRMVGPIDAPSVDAGHPYVAVQSVTDGRIIVQSCDATRYVGPCMFDHAGAQFLYRADGTAMLIRGDA